LGAAIDGARIGLVGHSVGGAAAALGAHQDGDVACAANLDGDYGGVAAAARPRQPLFYLLTSDANENSSSRARRARVWREVSARSALAAAFRVSAMKHLNFVDAALLSASMTEQRRQALFGAISTGRGLQLTGALLGGFLDGVLKARADALAQAVQETPEVVAAF
jgi:dienelactone hydrolase